MPLDLAAVAARITGETGLKFTALEGRDAGGNRWIELQPEGYSPAESFALRTTIGWRSLRVEFRPGSFAHPLLGTMSGSDEPGRALFSGVLAQCRSDGADLEFSINGRPLDPLSAEIWAVPWGDVALAIRRGQLAVNTGDDTRDEELVFQWTARLAAAVLALLPLEPIEEPENPLGLPEGAVSRIEVNRYERDRRNRAAALAIHGLSCKACGLDMSDRYGAAAAGFIEVHHTTPVSAVGAGYMIDPRTDLLPLCPNCHAVVHRRTPPYSLEEISLMLATQRFRGNA